MYRSLAEERTVSATPSLSWEIVNSCRLVCCLRTAVTMHMQVTGDYHMRIGLMSSAALALLLGAGSVAHAQVSIGVAIGRPPAPVVIEEAPPAPRAYVVAAQPGPEFVWVEGYWFPQGTAYRCAHGYWP